MIETTNATKYFDDLCAVDHITATIKRGSVFGLIGSNGAGKSTYLRMLAGILQADEGQVLVNGEPIFENIVQKQNCFYISDDQYFYPNCTPNDMMEYYALQYAKFDKARYHKLMDAFSLDGNRKIRTFSKGMKKQVSVICGVSAMTDYLFCDETFDGLDPVMRQAVKSIFATDVAEREMTPVVASHNLRELEDICDHVGLLHRGGILFSRDLDDMKLGMQKVQVIFRDMPNESFFASLDILHREHRGSLVTLTVRASREQVQNLMSAQNPIFFEMLPLTLEEIFISETEVAGYDVKKLLL